jgi:hypothetical protein
MMPQQTLAQRVLRLEGEMTDLRELPWKVEGLTQQVLQLRTDLNAGFSALRTELQAEIRAEIRASEDETRRQMRVLHEDVISRIALLDEALNGRGRKSRRRPKR